MYAMISDSANAAEPTTISPEASPPSGASSASGSLEAHPERASAAMASADPAPSAALLFTMSMPFVGGAARPAGSPTLPLCAHAAGRDDAFDEDEDEVGGEGERDHDDRAAEHLSVVAHGEPVDEEPAEPAERQ